MDTKAIEKLADAVWQALDDMGKEGQSCCLASKALLRAAYEPFLQDRLKSYPLMDPDYTFEEAAALLKELGL